jgi:hypothetical protein
MRVFTLRALVMLVFFLFVSALVAAIPRDHPNRVTVSYGSTSPITLHEPIYVDVSISNGLSDKIWFDMGNDRKTTLIFNILRPDGSYLQVRAPEHGGIGDMIGRISVAPQKSYAERFLVTDLYFFDQPGKYQIEVSLDAAIHLGEAPPEPEGATLDKRGSKIEPDRYSSQKGTAPMAVSGNTPITIEVLDRDPKVLSQRCEDLLRVVDESASLQEVNDAAEALSYTIDPVSVPFFERMLALKERHPAVVVKAITGLGRVGNRAAVKALRSAAERDREYIITGAYVRSLAKRMLRRIEQGEPDPLARGKLTFLD